MAKTASIINHSSTAPVSNPTVLTVIVLNSNNQPVMGAQVSMEPSGLSGVTDLNGQVQLQLGSSSQYQVTASADNKTVTVPYYVTPNGATRLVVNPSYVESVEARMHPSPWTSPQFLWTAGIVLAVIVIAVVAWKMFRRK